MFIVFTVQIDSDPCETALRAAKCAKDEGEKVIITYSGIIL